MPCGHHLKTPPHRMIAVTAGAEDCRKTDGAETPAVNTQA
jgi:hypothetical protein